MNNEAQLTSLQFGTAAVVLALATVSETGEVAEFDARTGGARVDALKALVKKGVLTVRFGDWTATESHTYAGETLTNQAFYAAA